MRTRLVYIDILKTVGLLAVILAHVNPPFWLKQARSFDVCLLVIISGYLAGSSFLCDDSLSLKQVTEYIYKRVQRLVIPAWLFIAFFLPIQSLLYHVPTLHEIVLAVTFQKDCGLLGYLWIVWVFFVCACLVPFISQMKNKTSSMIIWTILLIVTELIIQFTNLEQNRILYCTLFTIVPYGFLTYLGINLDRMNLRRATVISSIVFFVLASSLFLTHGVFVETGKFKYPARIYYLSYGISISLILFMIVKNSSSQINKLFSFVSSHTLWIYFWHILFLYGIQFIMPAGKWWMMFIIVVILSVSVTFIQSIVVEKYICKVPFLKYFKG